MMNFFKKQIKNILFVVVLALLLIPQTRQPIQVFLNKGLAYFSPSIIDVEAQKHIDNYTWQLSTLKGEPYNFEAAKGNVVLINFWATWCPPCVAELPSMQDLYVDYKDRVVFLFVTNEGFETVAKFLNNKNYNLPVYNPVTEYPVFFNLKSIPRTFLIDKNGAVIIDKTGAANWNSDLVRTTINDLLKQ